MASSTISVVPLVVDGRRVEAAADEHADVFNPSAGSVICRVPMCGPAEVDDAVRSALAAFERWSQSPAPKRAEVLFRYKAILEDQFEALAGLVSTENGKTLEEGRGDVRRGIEVVDFSCGIAHLGKGETLGQLAEHIDGHTTREPIGVCAGITPFNFPAMVPLWMFPVAIACGNSFVLKPSEKVPLTAVRLAELALEAGLPPGVLNVVHGGRPVVESLCRHPDIASVSFVGSTAVAEQVYRMGCETGKRVQAAGGAKNVMIVMPDAEPDSTIRAVMGAAYGCAGQRCMAGSIVMGVGDAAGPLERRLSSAIDALVVDDTVANPDAQMGPLIDASARDRVARYIDNGQREGARLARDGREKAPSSGFFLRPTLFDEVQPDMSIARDEVFGPLLSMQRPADLDEAIERANRSPYGNGAVIFTSSGAAARRFARGIRCGMVGVNVGVPAPMAAFAFSGWNRSFFGDLHVQGHEGVMFYTRQKIVLSRWDDTYERQQGW
ncbi:MAG: methylmalonate-semialdehyde dehydrogenase (CoA acylating) [Phycisphaeraceae bacterium]|nr:methylmalonate-semialdehyde dehydrogenase (CoA acylating) [Phycisphaeraceae bacterium]